MRYSYEFVRCTRHNVCHLKKFAIRYLGGEVWEVSDGEFKLRCPWYPYQAMHDVEGYLMHPKYRIAEGDTVVDAGGCRGEFSAYAALKVGPKGRVVMLEPDGKNLEYAYDLFALNGLTDRIEVIREGLWSRDQLVSFEAGSGATSKVLGAEASEAGGDVIAVTTLLSLADRLGLKRIDFVKMDIEGAELQALNCVPMLPIHLTPSFSIASYHVVDGEQTWHAVEAMLSACGYSCETGNSRHLTTWATKS